MEKSKDLLRALGVVNYTQRHLHLVDEFLNSGETDAKKLLDQLGGWDVTDLKVVENFLKS